MTLAKFSTAREIWNQIERLRQDLETVDLSMNVVFETATGEQVIYVKHYREHILIGLRSMVTASIRIEIEKLQKEFDAL